jgi:hypothetical protein
MIRYTLKCAQYHEFDSWFKSADAFEKLRDATLVTCPSCGSDEVEKAIMAPQVRPSRKSSGASAVSQLEASPKEGDRKPPLANQMHALTAPSSAAEAAMIELKRKVQESSEYVGSDFATEARKIHDGDAPERSIYGEAEPEEARKLVEDGVPVAPLPFIPSRKTN